MKITGGLSNRGGVAETRGSDYSWTQCWNKGACQETGAGATDSADGGGHERGRVSDALALIHQVYLMNALILKRVSELELR